MNDLSQTHSPSPSAIRKAEILREAKAANRMRLNLEKAVSIDIQSICI